MSHVAKVDLIIMNDAALRLAVKELGLEIREKNNYIWFNRHVGDYPIPAGFKESDLGKCEYAIGIPGDPRAYEVGVVKNPNGPGKVLLFDFWNGGYGLEAKIGKNANKLKQAYATNVMALELIKQGRQFTKSINKKGQVVLIAQT